MKLIISLLMYIVRGFPFLVGPSVTPCPRTGVRERRNNAISVEQLARAMRLGKLGEQIVIKSKYALSKLHYEGFDIAEREAYYQWYSGRKFRDIFKVFAFDDLQNMYYTLHEADVSKFVDIVNRRVRDFFPDYYFRENRKLHGAFAPQGLHAINC